jgi:hypothetical protein
MYLFYFLFLKNIQSYFFSFISLIYKEKLTYHKIFFSFSQRKCKNIKIFIYLKFLKVSGKNSYFFKNQISPFQGINLPD